jgi:hypothetical protein
MRSIRGEIVLPDDAPPIDAGLVVVEVRDVSLMDAPSVVVADWRRDRVPILAGARIPFELEVPERAPGSSLSARAHVSLDGSGVVRRGDLISAAIVPVPATGEVGPIDVPTVTV